MSSENSYDIVIVGGGPAGLTAGIYSARAGMKTLLLEGNFIGGQAALTDRIENYPGFPDGVNGAELLILFEKQARRFGVSIKTETAKKIEENAGKGFIVSTSSQIYETLSVIIASGAQPRKLNIPGESEFTGRGVSYCATCDGPFYRNKIVAVVGGGDAAAEEAVFLAKFASKVYLIHRREKLRATKVIRERAAKNEKIEFVWNSVPEEISGGNSVEGIIVLDKKMGKKTIIKCDGVFIFAGFVPATDVVKGIVDRNVDGRIITDRFGRTSKEGVFASGDCTDKKLFQVSTAVGDGAAAAFSASAYIDGLKGNEYD